MDVIETTWGDMSEEAEVTINEILSAKQSKYKPIEVNKEVEVEVDIGNLLVTDTNVLQSDELKLVIEYLW